MPVFQVDLADGRAFEIESDVPPSEQDVMTALGHGAENVGFDDRMGQGKTWINSDEAPEKTGILPEGGNEVGPTELNAFSLPLALFGNLLAGVANPVYNLVTGHDPKAKKMEFDTRIGAPDPGVQEVGPRFKGGHTVFKDPAFARPLREDIAINRGLNSLWEGVTTPEGLATAAAGRFMRAPGVVGQLANVLYKGGGATFLLDILGHAPESTKRAAGDLGTYFGTPESQRTPDMVDRTQDSVIQEVFNKVFLGSGAGHIRNSLRGTVDNTVTPEVYPDMPRSTAPANRQLEAGRGEVIDLENVGGVYRAPTDVAKQIEGPRRQFVTDEMGQTIPREQFDPMQGQDALAHRQPLQAYRPAPPVIETPEVQIQNTLKSIEARLNEFVQASKPAPTIVPANQALGTKSPEPQLPTQEITKLSPSSPAINRPGGAFREDVVEGKGVYNTDPNFGVSIPEKSGQAPYNPTPGPGRPSPKQAERQALEEGLGLPSGYYTGSESLPYAKEGQFPVEGGPTGAFSKLQRERIQAGKEDVRSNERNNPPGEPPGEDPITYYNSGPFTKAQQDAMNAFLKRAIDAAIKAGKALTYADLQVLRNAGTDRLRKGLPIDGDRLPDIRGGATAELMRMGDDAASLPAREKMISGEGESSGVEGKAREIEDGNVSLTEPAPDKVEIQHILGNAAQLVKSAEHIGDITKEQSVEFQRRGDEAFGNLDTNPELAREQAKKLREDVSPKNTDPKYGKRTDSSGNLYGDKPTNEPQTVESGLSQAAQSVFDAAKTTKDEFSGVSANHLTKEDRRALALKGLSFTENRKGEVQVTYPAKLRQQDLRDKVTSKGGIGGGISRAVEKNKEAGSILNPFRKVNRPLNRTEFLDTQKFRFYPDEVRAATTPHGVGQIPHLGKLFDDRARKDSVAEKALLTNAILQQKSKHFSDLWLERQKDVQREFKHDNNRQITLANGTKDYRGDVIEAELANPGSQPLTKGQRDFVQAWKELRQKKVQEAIDAEVKFFVDENGQVIPINENYFPRDPVGKEGIEAKVKGIKSALVGARPSFTKGRQWKTEREGVEKGKIIYEQDEFQSIAKWLTSVDRAIADSLLAHDPAVAGRVGTPIFLEEGAVNQPAFRGRAYPLEIAKKMQKYYGQGHSRAFQAMNRVNNEMKAAEYTLDASAPLNQGLPLLFTAPHRWMNATIRHFEAYQNDRVMNRELKKPETLRVVKLIIEGNGSLIRNQDFLQGADAGTYMERVPVVRQSARAMSTFMTLAKVHFFKAYEAQAKKEGMSLADLVESVENAALSGRMEMTGMTPGRALFERLVLLNAPSYVRAAASLTAQTVMPGVKGRIAQRALIGMATGILALAYGLYKYYYGMDEKEIRERMSPTGSKFLYFPYKMDNGQNKEIAYFNNIFISSTRALGQVYNIATTDKEWGVGNEDPVIKWVGNRNPPLMSLGKQVITGKDFRGEPISKTEAGLRSMMPITADPLTEDNLVGETGILPQSKRVGLTAQFFGMGSFNESKGAFRQRKMEEISQRKYKKPFTKLGAVDRGFVTEEAEELTDKTIDTKTSPQQVMNIVTDTEKRRTNLTKSLSKENQEWLKKNRLEVTSYQETMSIDKREVKLADDDEKKMLQKFMSEETEKAITTLRTNRNAPDQERVNERLKLAHIRAWRLMRNKMK